MTNKGKLVQSLMEACNHALHMKSACNEDLPIELVEVLATLSVAIHLELDYALSDWIRSVKKSPDDFPYHSVVTRNAYGQPIMSFYDREGTYIEDPFRPRQRTQQES